MGKGLAITRQAVKRQVLYALHHRGLSSLIISHLVLDSAFSLKKYMDEM